MWEFDDYSGTWSETLEVASTPEYIDMSTIDTEVATDWSWTDGLESVAGKALATYETLARLENNKKAIELQAAAAAGNLKLQQATQASNAQLAQSQLTTQGTLARLQNAASVAGAQAKAALPQALAMVAQPQILLLIAAALGVAWYAKRT